MVGIEAGHREGAQRRVPLPITQMILHLQGHRKSAQPVQPAFQRDQMRFVKRGQRARDIVVGGQQTRPDQMPGA